MAAAARRGRGLLVVILVVALLCGLAVAADRVAAAIAEDRAAARIQQRLHLARPPDVSIEGFPFLTQLAGRTFGHVVITAADATLTGEGGQLSVQRVHLDLHRVRVSQSVNAAVIGRLTGTVSLTWAAISRLSGHTIGFDHTDAQGRGWVRITASTQVADATIRVKLVARPVLETHETAIRLADPQLTVLGSIELPGRVSDAIVSQLVDTITLPMPRGITATRVTVTPEGVRLGVAGTDVRVGGS